VAFDVKNAGLRGAAEVAQVYVGDPKSGVPRPPRELKGFAKVALAPGETRRVRLTLGPDAFAFYAPDRAAWVVEPGAFEVAVGVSSRDLRLKGRVERTAATVKP
jgi:beta-glucosidase